MNTDGGHGGGASAKRQRKAFGAVRAFLKKALGPINQDVYKAPLKNQPATTQPQAKGPKAG